MKTRVLLVDDDPELLDITRILMQQSESELELVTLESTKDVLDKIEREEFDIIISDYLMPDSTGLDLLEVLREEKNEVSFIIWTGHSSEEIAIRGLNLGVDYYILKGSMTVA
ncbi:response regulator [Candidatus Thorarchaeota archaeon]|nr:MAG: response regulator [Candidatus Thorarchaeota archaeon]